MNLQPTKHNPFRPRLIGRLLPTALAGAGVGFMVLVSPVAAQEALRNNMAINQANEAHQNADAQPYNIKMGDLRMMITPSLAFEYNDNVSISEGKMQDDYIIRPLVRFDGIYPLTDRNVLTLNVGVGYDEYVQHSEHSRFRLESGSGLSFDMWVREVKINLHDRFSYTQDSALEPAVANTADFGSINNTVGALVSWDINGIVMDLGYDHQNTMSTSDSFTSQDSSTEMVVSRAGLQVHPQLTVGVEGSGSFKSYDQRTLNNNSSYSAGGYGDWQPGSYFHVQPRAGYTITAFRHTSSSIETKDVGSWYADLTLSHAITEAINYSVSGGHEIRAGVESDAIETWYARPTINWNFIKNVGISTGMSYEHGKQGVGNVVGNLSEAYDWWGSTLSINYALVQRLSMGMNYRYTLRSADIGNRGYTQNVVTLQFSYRL